MIKSIIAAAALACAVTVSLAPAFAQDGREAQMIGFHQLCDRGDKAACVRFGMMLQQNQDHHAEWRRSHPEFFFFER